MTLPVISCGNPGQMILDFLVCGLHEGEAVAERSFAASFRSGRAVSASLELRYSTYPLCRLGSFDQMCLPSAVPYPSEGLMTKLR